MKKIKIMKINNIILNAIIFLYCALPINALELSSRANLSLTEEYNDNIYLDNENEEEDFITIITPGIQTSLNWQRTGLTAAYDLGYSIYNDHSENDSFRHHGNLGWWWNVFQNTRFSLSDTYIKSEDISDMPDSESETGRREGFYSNSTQMNLVHRFGENRSVSTGYVYEIFNYDDDQSEDHKSHVASMDTTYFFSPHIGLDTHVVYTKGLYEESQDYDEWVASLRLMRNISRRLQLNGSYTHTIMTREGVGSENDYQIYNPSVGFSYILGEEGTIGLNIGYFFQDIDSQENESGLTVDGNVGQSWRFKQGTFRLSGSSGYENSQLNSENLGFTVFYGAESRLDYQLSRSVSSSIQASYRHNDYVNSSIDDSDRVDKSIISGCTLNWQITRWLSSSLDYNFRNLNSNMDENDYTENRVIIRINIMAQSGREESVNN